MPHKDPEKSREYKRQWNLTHPNYHRSRYQDRKSDPEFRKIKWAAKLYTLYRLRPEDYQKLWDSQSGRCGICQDLFTQTPCVDHDHVTGQVRGLLCRQCNSGLGHFQENPEILQMALEYLYNKTHEPEEISPRK